MWFANKGQVVQMIAAVVSASLAVGSFYFVLKSNNSLPHAALVLYVSSPVFLLLVGFLLGRRFAPKATFPVSDKDRPKDSQWIGQSHGVPTPLPSWVRFRSAYPEIAGPPAPGNEPAKKPQKVRCEFVNCTDVSYKVKIISWDCGSRGLDADFWLGCLQLRLGNSWYPEWSGVEELHVPPGEAFRFWVFPKSTFNDEQFRARVNTGNLGIAHFLINGKEVAVPVGATSVSV